MGNPQITGVETYVVDNPWKPWVFVEVETDVGVTGVAEATVHKKPRTVATAIDELEQFYVGEDPFETERLYLEMNRNLSTALPHRINAAVFSAMDIACWDIKGKVLDRPVYELLGGSVHGDSLRAYANAWYTDVNEDGERSPERFAEAAAGVVADGYDALKFDPFGTAWERMTRAETNRSLAIVEAIRDRVGPDIDLLIEGHYRFSHGTAIELARKLEPYDPTWFEQPTPPDTTGALRRVASRSRVPIAVDVAPETGVDADLLDTGIDVLQPDPIHTGGITTGKKIAGMAEREHVGYAPHNAQGPVNTAVCAHLAASAPNFVIQEVMEEYGHPEWAADLLEDPLTIEDGQLYLPDGPGLGVSLNHDALEKHAYTGDLDGVLNLFGENWESRSFDQSD